MAKSTAQLIISFEKERKCSICFSQITRRCLTDWCRHHFCFKCLIRWAEEHNYCPECRQIFKAILYVNDLRYENDFDVFIIENKETKTRRTLNTRSDALKNDLLKEIERRKANINELKQTILELEDICDQIDCNIRELDSKERKNNGDLDLTLNRIEEQLEFYRKSKESDYQQSDDIPSREPNEDNAVTESVNQSEGKHLFCIRCWFKSVFESIVGYFVGCFRFKIKVF